MSRKLSDRFELRLVGEFEDTFILTHGHSSWIDFPKSHLGALYRLVGRELQDNGEGSADSR